MTRRRQSAGDGPADYTQRPQRPIRLKPGLADEPTGNQLPDAPPGALLHGEAVGAPPAAGLTLPPELRARAEAAARSAGLHLEAWVQEVLTRELDAEARGQGPTAERLRALEVRVDALERAGFWDRLLGRRRLP